MGFPFSSYTDEPPSTSATAAESMDSHWLRPIESPTNTSRRFRSVSSSRAACRTPPPPGVLAVRPAVLGAPEPGVDERAPLGLVQRVVPRVVAHPLAFHGHASEVVVAAVPTAPLFVVVVVASTSAEEKAKMSRESTQAPHTTMSRPAGGLPLLRALAMSIASCFRRSRPAARRTCVRKRLLVLPFLCAGQLFLGLRGRNKGWMMEESAGALLGNKETARDGEPKDPRRRVRLLPWLADPAATAAQRRWHLAVAHKAPLRKNATVFLWHGSEEARGDHCPVNWKRVQKDQRIWVAWAYLIS
jgi:hypothetical protein